MTYIGDMFYQDVREQYIRHKNILENLDVLEGSVLSKEVWFTRNKLGTKFHQFWHYYGHIKYITVFDD